MAKNNKSGLTLKNRIGYGCGDAGGVMTFMLMSTFFTRYCLNILGVSSAVLATLLLIWNIWDAVNDPLMGALMDKVFAKHHNKKGKFRPWILRATPMMCVSAIALWTLPTYFEGVTMIAVLFVCKILYEGFYTMLNIPMGFSAVGHGKYGRRARPAFLCTRYLLHDFWYSGFDVVPHHYRRVR